MTVIKKSMVAMDGRVIKSAVECVKYAREIYADLDDDQEHAVCMYFNGGLELMKHKVVSSGGQDSTPLDPKIIFRHALLCGASKLVLFHNHNVNSPPVPSKDDIECTNRLIKGGELLDIDIVDHIVLSRGGWYSFSNNKKLK